MVATELKNRGLSNNGVPSANEGREDITKLDLRGPLLALPHNFRSVLDNISTNQTLTASLRDGYVNPTSARQRFSNVVEIPAREMDPQNGNPGTDPEIGHSSFSPFGTTKGRGLGTALAGIAASLALLEPVKSALMMNTYADPVARQAHRDKGLEFKDTVVSVFVDGVHEGSGVLIGDGGCVIFTWHQLREAGVTHPLNKRVQIKMGANSNEAGQLVDVIDFIKHPAAPSAGQQGTDIIVGDLAQIPAGAKPSMIATVAPIIGENLEIAGFGDPYVPYTPLTPLGELLGGYAPVHQLPSSGGGYITTLFKIDNNLPLLQGGTPNDSGGFVGKTTINDDGSNSKLLFGTIVGGTSPSINQGTFSVNLVNHRTWILEQVAKFSPISMPKLSCELLPDQEMKINCNGASLQQSTGKWILQKSTNLQEWSDLPEETQSRLIQYSSLTVTTAEQRAFYRLRWDAN